MRRWRQRRVWERRQMSEEKRDRGRRGKDVGVEGQVGGGREGGERQQVLVFLIDILKASVHTHAQCLLQQANRRQRPTQHHSRIPESDSPRHAPLPDVDGWHGTAFKLMALTIN